MVSDPFFAECCYRHESASIDSRVPLIRMFEVGRCKGLIASMGRDQELDPLAVVGLHLACQ